MNKEIQTVYVPISTNERLPSEEGTYIGVRAYFGGILEPIHFYGGQFETSKSHRVLFWLEPQQYILLTKDEYDHINNQP
jgi:hypothetical protein